MNPPKMKYIFIGFAVCFIAMHIIIINSCMHEKENSCLRLRSGECAYLKIHPEVKGTYLIKDCGFSCWESILRIKSDNGFQEINVEHRELKECNCDD